MRFSKEHKAETRTRIVDKAGSLFRRHGAAGVSVPGLMKEAGLTHGGFYAHFASKDALIAEAVTAAIDATFEHFRSLARDAPDPLAAIIENYVSAAHRDHPESGCAVAAVGSETARDSVEGGRAMAAGAERTVARLAAALGDDIGFDEDDGIELYASMVGAIVVSRACAADPAFADRILTVCRERFKRRFVAPPKADANGADD